LSNQKQFEQLFRREYGHLVALLVKRAGIDNLDKIEDSIQWAMAQAIEGWNDRSRPASPEAWLYRVAYHHLMAELRVNNRRFCLLREHFSGDTEFSEEQDATHFPGEISDLLLQMLFVTCDPDMPVASQLVFTLKSLCGFSIKDIGLRLFLTESNVYKRFSRAKSYLKHQTLDLSQLSQQEIQSRLCCVYRVLYLLFTEGYLSSDTDKVIRFELCHEAIRLTKLLTETHAGDVPQTWALLALMYFHQARIEGRQDEYGALLLLEHQDRKLWDQQKIAFAMCCLEKSATGDVISRYHVEAGIAAEHCMSVSFESTAWDKIVSSYKLLYAIAPSPLHLLNLAIAMAQWQGAKAGLSILDSYQIPDWLHHTYHWFGVKADFYFRCNDKEKGDEYAKLAMAAAPTDNIKALLQTRFSQAVQLKP